MLDLPRVVGATSPAPPLPAVCNPQNGDHAATYRKADLPAQSVPGRAVDFALEVDEQLFSSRTMRIIKPVELLKWAKVRAMDMRW